MRPFDIIGILAVACWVGVIGAFLFDQHRQGPQEFMIAAGELSLREATMWMGVVHAGEDVGVIREDRTRLIDGWLFETQGIVTLHLLQDTYSFRFESRTNLDEEARLRTAIGSIEAFGKTARLDGRYRRDGEEHFFDVTITFDGASERFSVPLVESPRLVSLAIPQMLASEDLRPGATLSQEFFDPLTLTPTSLTLTYEGTEEYRHYGEDFEAHRFRQSYGNIDAAFLTEADGTPLVHVMPFDFRIARLPEFLGEQAYREAVEAYGAREEEVPAFIEALDASFLLGMVARLGSGQTDRLQALEGISEELFDDGEEREPGRTFALTSLPEVRRLQLESPRQRVVTQMAGFTEILAGSDNPLWHSGLAPSPSDYEGGEEDPGWGLDREGIAAAVAETDCEGAACAVVVADGLAATGRAPHLVHGVFAPSPSLGDVEPRVWVAVYDDADLLLEVDPLSPGGRVGASHLQLFLASELAMEDLSTLAAGAEFYEESTADGEP